MRLKFCSYVMISVISVFMLAACGGGDSGSTTGSSGSGSSGSSGSSVSIGSGTSTGGGASSGGGTTVTNSSLRALVADETYSVAVAMLTMNTNASGDAMTTAITDPTVENALTYRASTQAYNFASATTLYSESIAPNRDFLPSDISATTLRTTTYTNAGPDPLYQYSLIRANAAATNDQIQLTYATYGAFVFSHLFKVGMINLDYRAFAYGYPTPSAGMPTTGTATFTGVIMGTAGANVGTNFAQPTYSVSGQLSLTVNFATRSATGTITLAGQRGNTSVSFGTITLTQAAATSLAGFTGTAGTGNFRAFVAGPNANELGLVSTFSIPNAGSTGYTYLFSISGAAVR